MRLTNFEKLILHYNDMDFNASEILSKLLLSTEFMQAVDDIDFYIDTEDSDVVKVKKETDMVLDDIKERKDSKADLEKRRDELLSELYWVLHDLEDEEGYIHEALTTTLINRIFTIDDVLDLIVEKGE